MIEKQYNEAKRLRAEINNLHSDIDVLRRFKMEGPHTICNNYEEKLGFVSEGSIADCSRFCIEFIDSLIAKKQEQIEINNQKFEKL